MIEVSNLRKAYKNFCLNNISFSIRKGEITGFIGNNGAGKTTTLKCILGLVAYDMGQILLDGKSMLQNEQEYKEKIGVVFDKGYFYDNLTMFSMKNIIAKAYTNWDDLEYQKYMEKFELIEKQIISTLSQGMKMKFALALALSHNADTLILDEPTSGLDPNTRHLFCEELLEQKRKGKTIFFSTHITSDLDKIGDNIILIDHGSILSKGSKQKFLQESKLKNPTIEDAMLELISKGEV